VNTVRRTALSVVMIGLACLVALPLYYILVNTFKTQAEMVASPIGLPPSFNLDNYVRVFQDVPLVRSFGNTLYVTVVGVLVQVLIGAMAAYGMIMRATRFNRILGLVLVLGFVVPAQSTLIPLYRMLVGVELVDSLNGLVIMYSAGAIFCFFLIQGYMRTLPFELIEAAMLDGAGVVQIFWRIILPMTRPALAALGALAFTWTFNDLLWSITVLRTGSVMPVTPALLGLQGQYVSNWNVIAAGSVIAAVPTVAVFLRFQKHFISGLAIGAIK
jgi:raffinose/stachyose/melibiose transport system permease protein